MRDIVSETIEAIDQSVKAISDREGKYLTFSLAGEEYGIPMSRLSITARQPMKHW